MIAGTAGSNPADDMDVPLVWLLYVVYVAASATSRSLVQGSSTWCVCVCVCDLETSTMRRPSSEWGCCVTERKKERKKKERLLLRAESQYSVYAMGSSIEESETITEKVMRFFPIPTALPGREAHQVSHPVGARNSLSEGKASRA